MARFFSLIAAFMAFLAVALTLYPRDSRAEALLKSVDELCSEKSLSPEQCGALKAELSKTGSVPTRQEIESLKVNKELIEANRAEPKEEVKIEKTGDASSLFERYISDAVPEGAPLMLKPFGYNLFTGPAISPSQDLPVASDYIIGPGDEVGILLWGRVNGHYSLAVSREGAIQFPNIGPMRVAGMTYDEMKRFLTHQAKSIVGTEINITMGRLRGIQVFVLGEVKKPGAYGVSAMSTLTGALMASGGPTGIGTLRRVELKRDNKTVSVMDFYGLLLEGDRSGDLRLQNGDVIFVPTVGPLVGVAGNVKRPAIYELKEAEDLSGILRLAGGIIPTAYTQQIQVERVDGNIRRIVVDVNAMEGGAAKGFTLQDADLVKVYSIFDKDANAVYLYGNVKRPGKYELKPGMRLKDIIKDAGDLLNDTYLEYGLVKRPVQPSGESILMPFNPGNLLFRASEGDNIELKAKDAVHIFSKWSFKDRPSVTVEGEVRKGGTFEMEDNLTVKDLMLKAGDLTRNAYADEAELYRTAPDTRDVTLFKFNLKKAMDGDGANNLTLKDMDRVVVHSIWEIVPKQFVTVKGEVTRPGQYPYVVNMTVSDLVFASGNALESAYLDEAELASHIVKEGRLSQVSFQTIDLGGALKGEKENIRLRPYDSLFVKKIPEWREERFVTLSGEVKFPGSYIFKKGERLSSLIERAGGFADRAYLKGAVFTRESARAFQQKNLEDAINRLEQTILSQSAGTMEAALTPEASRQMEAAAQRKALIARMRETKAKGRIVLSLAPSEKLKDSPYDIALEDGDTLYVPQRPAVVSVLGAVSNPASFVYDPGHGISGYIAKAGGVTELAERKRTYVVKVDGSSLSPEAVRGWRSAGWNDDTSGRDTGGDAAGLDPGDTIVVPEQIERIAWLRETKDITQILYQIAVTAGVIIVAF